MSAISIIRVSGAGTCKSSLRQDATRAQRKAAKAAARSGAIPPMAEVITVLRDKLPVSLHGQGYQGSFADEERTEYETKSEDMDKNRRAGAGRRHAAFGGSICG